MKLVDGVLSSKHPLYHTWTHEKQRCYNLNHKDYPRYGGRGISMFPAWRHDFAAFAQWVTDNLGERPLGYHLDRIDNDGNYWPGNLRWAHPRLNARNRSVVGTTPGVTVGKHGNGWVAVIQLQVGRFVERGDADMRRKKIYAKWGGTLDRIAEWADTA